jgi:hypothetical protein
VAGRHRSRPTITSATTRLRSSGTIDGFRGAQLLRRADGDEVLFTAITWFTHLNAIRDYAGENYEQAVMEEPAVTALTRWDERVIHHVVEVNVPG